MTKEKYSVLGRNVNNTLFSVILVIEEINGKRKCPHKMHGIWNSGVLDISVKITSHEKQMLASNLYKP